MTEMNEKMIGIRNIVIGDFVFTMTSEACPEQYDVFRKDDMDSIVCYVRLRHGYLYAVCPDVGGEFVYETNVDGHGGYFCNEEERIKHLILIKTKIEKWLKRSNEE